MLSWLRGSSPPRTNSASQNPVVYENGKSKVEFHPPSTRDKHFMMTNVMSPIHPERGPSILQPPFHFHIHQSERFKMVSGTGHFYKGIGTKPFVTLSATSGSGSTSGRVDGRSGNRLVTASIESRRYHRFENASSTEDLIVEIQLDPENYEDEVRFFRNFFGYLDDCRRHDTAPSIFQLMVFLHSADTPLAIVPPFLASAAGEYVAERVGVLVSLMMTFLLAFVGRSLGYRSTYDEYYLPSSVPGSKKSN